MEQQKLFKVRDKRNKGWFYLDNEYLNGYAKLVGPVATAIYVSLCRHANDNQQCFPSRKKMAEEFNISEKTIKRHLKKLEKYNLISVQQEKGENGKFKNNVYTLMDKDVWSPPWGQKGTTVNRGDKLSSTVGTKRDTTVGTNLPNKDTNKKKTNISNKINDDSENRPVKRKDFKVSIGTYKRLTDAYQQFKGIELKGAEFGQVKQAIKTMLYSGRTEQEIMDFMKFAAEKCEQITDPAVQKEFCWLKNWTMITIKKKMPEFLAGKFGGQEEPIIPSYAKHYV